MRKATERPDGRLRLVDAALSCLADHGHKGTTVRRIAERAGVTAGLVRHHFDDKDNLLIESYRHINSLALQRMADVSVEDGADIDQALERAIRAFFPENLSDPRRMRIMVAFWGLVLTNPEIAKIQEESYSAFQAFFVGLIERHLGSRADAKEMASGIIAVADGLWLECCLNPERMTPEQAVRTAIRFSQASLS